MDILQNHFPEILKIIIEHVPYKNPLRLVNSSWAKLVPLQIIPEMIESSAKGFPSWVRNYGTSGPLYNFVVSCRDVDCSALLSSLPYPDTPNFFPLIKAGNLKVFSQQCRVAYGATLAQIAHFRRFDFAEYVLSHRLAPSEPTAVHVWAGFSLFYGELLATHERLRIYFPEFYIYGPPNPIFPKIEDHWYQHIHGDPAKLNTLIISWLDLDLQMGRVRNPGFFDYMLKKWPERRLFVLESVAELNNYKALQYLLSTDQFDGFNFGGNVVYEMYKRKCWQSLILYSLHYKVYFRPFLDRGWQENASEAKYHHLKKYDIHLDFKAIQDHVAEIEY